MNCDPVDAKRLKVIALLRLGHLALLIDLRIGLLKLRQYIPALVLSTQVQHLPKDRACAIKVRRRGEGDEELASVYCRASGILRTGRCLVLDRARSHG